jgi:hypothetical protein
MLHQLHQRWQLVQQELQVQAVEIRKEQTC